MSLFQVIVLALVQGLTEFLPISSSAHLALAPWLLGWKDQGLTFDIALHFGTLLAVLLYFFRDWLQILAAGFGVQWGPDSELRSNPRLLWFLAAASAPVGVAGLMLKDYAENSLRNPVVIGCMLIAVGLVMAAGEQRGRLTRRIDSIRLRDALWIGLAQALAVVPGTSRSGITIAAGLFRDLDREAAARFSFLLSTPAIAGAALLAFLDLQAQGGIPPEARTAFLLGVVLSALTGCAAIAFLLRYLRTRSLRPFVLYRIVFGIIVLALAAFFRGQAE
jgi:undecaprenyl-diphosphatase